MYVYMYMYMYMYVYVYVYVYIVYIYIYIHTCVCVCVLISIIPTTSTSGLVGSPWPRPASERDDPDHARDASISMSPLTECDPFGWKIRQILLQINTHTNQIL